MNKKLILYPMICISLFCLSGCGGGEVPLQENEMRFSLNNISLIKISYDEENITFKRSVGSQLIVKEYMSKNKKGYRAKVREKGRSIEIEEGGKPLFDGDFDRRIEVCLPESYDQDLTVTTSNGNIDMTGIEQKLETLRLDTTEGTAGIGRLAGSQIELTTTRGTIDFDRLQARKIKLETTEGKVEGAEMTGDITYTTTHGDFNVQAVSGRGRFTVNNEGALKVNFAQITGDVWLYNKNGEVRLCIPPKLSFYFEAGTKNGSISCSFAKQLKAAEHSLAGTVGDKAAVSIRAETRNGDIDVVQ